MLHIVQQSDGCGGFYVFVILFENKVLTSEKNATAVYIEKLLLLYFAAIQKKTEEIFFIFLIMKHCFFFFNTALDKKSKTGIDTFVLGQEMFPFILFHFFHILQICIPFLFHHFLQKLYFYQEMYTGCESVLCNVYLRTGLNCQLAVEYISNLMKGMILDLRVQF